jgi:predicted ribosomally synthesized peptide with SipW-like signal peptide
MANRDITLTRRKILAGVIATGTASGATGAGTVAFFTDTEETTANLSAGTLNLTVSGGSQPLVFLDKEDLEPGAGGTVTLPLKNVGSLTGFLDVKVVSVTDTEGTVHEPGDSSSNGELDDKVTVTAKLTGGTDGEVVLCSPNQTFGGLFVDNSGETFNTNYELPSGSGATFTLEWSLAGDAGSAITGDALSVTLGFELSQSADSNGTASCPESGENGGDSGNQGGSGTPPMGIVFTRDQGTLNTLSVDGGSVSPGADSNNVVAIGPGTRDFNDNGSNDIPFLKNKNSLRLIDSQDASARKTNLSQGGGPKADIQKTTLAVGTWQGSEQSVFFTGKGNVKIYRVTPGGSPSLVVDPDQGVSAVLGPADIDADGSDELLFVDDSKVVKYVESDESIVSTEQIVGSSNNVGAGPPTRINGNVRVPIVDDGNKVHLIGANGITSTLITGDQDAQAAKSALTATDIDDDGAPEVVYIDNSSTELKYIDDITGAKSIKTVTDQTGDPITADKKRGVLPGNMTGGR